MPRTPTEQAHHDIDRELDAEVASSADATNAGTQKPADHAKRVDAAHAKAKAAHAKVDKAAPKSAPDED